MDATKTLNALKELKTNDYQIGDVYDLMERVPDDMFVKLFPSKYGVQIIREDWGLRLISPPTIARDSNNCWSIIFQMKLWARWFQLMGAEPKREKGQRLLAETIHHTATELPFTPNPIETHPMIDWLTSIFSTDDNMSHIDHSIRMEVDSGYGQEFCEIRIGIVPESGGFPKSEFNSFPPLPPVPEGDFDSEIEKLFPKRNDLSDEELVKLYHLLLIKDRAIRYDLPYNIMPTHYPLRRKSSTKKKVYQEILNNSPFCILEKGTPTIATKAPFRSYEQYASDLFIAELYRFLEKRRNWCDSLRDGPYDLTILKRDAYPDGDNIPFDKLFHLLKSTFLIPMNDRINIRYAPDMDYGVCLVLTPGEAPKSSP